MKVLVTGATGLVGSWVTRELLSRGHSVRVLVRKTSSLANLEGLSVEPVEGDVLDRPSVVRALEGCEGVVHTAGVAHFMPGEEARMYAVNVDSVELVLGEALRAGVKRAVHTSSTAAIGGSLTPNLADETTPSNAEASGIDYFKSKFRGEQKTLELARQGLEVCAVRPVVLLGPGDIYHSSGTTFLAIAKGKMPVYVHGGASFADVRDVAHAHVEALERGRRGEVYILGGHNLEIREMMEIVSRMAGVPRPKPVPYPLAFTVATMSELSARLMGRKPDLSRQLLKASRLYTFASSEKAMRELGYRLRPFEESLRDTLRFFLGTGRLKPHTPELAALAKDPA